ncbi:TPA: hypothetical protein DIU27_05415 [Candidatus Collierbacteria bacterium]|nr:hypothetical protein [Candidatus Collierbacteria bacterium]
MSALANFLRGELKLMRVDMIHHGSSCHILISRVMSYGSKIPTYVAIAKIIMIDNTPITEYLIGIEPKDIEHLVTAMNKFELK